MEIPINGSVLIEPPQRIVFPFNNPTRKDIKREIINYKTKLEHRKTFQLTRAQNANGCGSGNGILNKSATYEPAIRIINNNNNCSGNSTNVKLNEVILTSRLRSYNNNNNSTNINNNNNSTFDNKTILSKKVNTIYKARSTLKNTNPFTQTSFKPFDFTSPLEKTFEPYIPLDKHFPKQFSTTALFFPKKLHTGPQSTESLCSILNKKKNDYLTYIQQNDPNMRIKDCYDELLKTKKHFYKRNHLTYILSKKFNSKDKNIPLIYNKPLSYNKKYKSESQKERNDKNCETFSKLRYFLLSNLDMKKQIIKEFFIRNKIYDETYYDLTILEQVARYIMNNYTKIDYSKSIRDIIDECVHGSNNVNVVNSSNISNYTYNNDKKVVRSKSMNDKLTQRDKKNKLIYAHKKGNVDVFQYSTLNQDLEEQKKLHRMLSHDNNVNSSECTMNGGAMKVSQFNDEQIQMLENELKDLNNVKLCNDNPIDRSIKRLYYEIKQREHTANPQLLPRRKHKLLEYIIFNNAKAQKDFERDIKEGIALYNEDADNINTNNNDDHCIPPSQINSN